MTCMKIISKVRQYFNVDYFQFIRTTVVRFKILSYFKYLDSLPPSQQTNEILSPPQILPTPQNNDYEKVSSLFQKFFKTTSNFWND